MMTDNDDWLEIKKERRIPLTQCELLGCPDFTRTRIWVAWTSEHHDGSAYDYCLMHRNNFADYIPTENEGVDAYDLWYDRQQSI
jgi:hypothetical protein